MYAEVHHPASGKIVLSSQALIAHCGTTVGPSLPLSVADTMLAPGAVGILVLGQALYSVRSRTER